MKARTTSAFVSFRCPDELMIHIEAIQAKAEIRPTLSAVVVKALSIGLPALRQVQMLKVFGHKSSEPSAGSKEDDRAR